MDAVSSIWAGGGSRVTAAGTKAYSMQPLMAIAGVPGGNTVLVGVEDTRRRDRLVASWGAPPALYPWPHAWDCGPAEWGALAPQLFCT